MRPAGGRWLTYERWRRHGVPRGTPWGSVAGDLRVLPGLASPQMGVDRDVLVHLPVGALTSGRRYPVLYLHDGQNLFDAATSYAGEWEVDETLGVLAAEGLELIVVGIPNGGERRYAEYTPYRGRALRGRRGGIGPAYLRFVVETVKPAVDAAFPTRTERSATGVMGSSLGGLVSLLAAIEHPATFGLVGAMSPAIPGGQGAIVGLLARLAPLPDRAYLDVGGREGANAPAAWQARRRTAAAQREAERVRGALLAAGLRPAVLRYVEDPAGEHREADWARRLPDALRFLYGGERR